MPPIYLNSHIQPDSSLALPVVTKADSNPESQINQLQAPKFSPGEINRLFQDIEKKEKQMDSITAVRTLRASKKQINPEKVEIDSSSIPYLFKEEDLDLPSNKLDYLNREYFSAREIEKPDIFRESESQFTESVEIESWGRPVTVSHNLKTDWIILILIASLILLAWLKLFYNKFLDQIMQSLTNFQLSTKLLRDKNIFSTRVSFALNLNFIFISALLAYLVLGVYGLRFLPTGDLQSYFFYSGIITFLLLLRYVVSYIVGHIFRKLPDFKEYLHEILIIYKNLGVFMIPVVFGIAYVQENLRIFLIYGALGMIFFAFILRIIKGYQILIKKEIFIFYLILYLCTLEILPLLIFRRIIAAQLQF